MIVLVFQVPDVNGMLHTGSVLQLLEVVLVS